MSTLARDRQRGIVPHIDQPRMDWLDAEIKAGRGDRERKLPDPPKVEKPPDRCRICGEKQRAKQLCSKHYMQERWRQRQRAKSSTAGNISGEVTRGGGKARPDLEDHLL